MNVIKFTVLLLQRDRLYAILKQMKSSPYQIPNKVGEKMIYLSNKEMKLELASPKQASDMPQAHIHDFYEICIMVSGDRRFFIHKDIYLAQPGDILLIPPGCMHRAVTISETYERYLVYFPENYIREKVLLTCFENAHIQISQRRFLQVSEVLQEMADEFKKNDEYSDIMIQNCVKKLLMQLCRYCKTPSVREFETYDKNMQAAALYIRSHYRESISLQMIADAVFLSPSYLSKRFKEVTGFGISEYINGVRIREAELLLSSTDKSIVEIADRCGFNDSNYFGDAFKKYIGCSPSQYRKQIANKKFLKKE